MKIGNLSEVAKNCNEIKALEKLLEEKVVRVEGWSVQTASITIDRDTIAPILKQMLADRRNRLTELGVEP